MQEHMNYMERAFAPVEAANREAVKQETWGHLAPTRNQKYVGHFIFAVGCFGDDPLNPIVLKCEFEGLNESPWFFDCLNDYLMEKWGTGHNEEYKNAGKVFRFDGHFRNYKFVGKVREMKLV
jgi:hypothetical protein